MTATATNTAEAPASSSTSTELIRSDWNDKGQCSNPEVIAIAKMPKGTSAKILLGVDPEGKWRAGYEFVAGAGTASAKAPNLSTSEAFADRIDAIHSALLVIARPFNENTKATRAIEAFHDALKAAQVYAEAAPGGVMREVLDEQRLAREGNPLPKGRFEVLAVSAISPNPENHRKTFDPESMRELQASLRQVGQLQPIAVRLLSPEELGELPGVGEAAPAQRYEIILGERRWRAHVGEGMETIEAKVYEGVSRAQAKAAALVENLQREPVNPVEEAEGLRDLIAVENLTQEACAIRVGRSRPAVANALRLLELTDLLPLIRDKKLTPAHAHALGKWKKRPLLMKAIAELAISRGASAGDLEEWNRSGGIPYQSELVSAGLIKILDRWNKPGGWNAEWPEEIRDHPDYEAREGGDQYVCHNPTHWGEVVARANAKIEAERAAAVEAEKRKNAKGAKEKVKAVEDLPRNAYGTVGNLSELQGLLPADVVHKLPETREPEEKGEKVAEVVICIAPKFLAKVEGALRELKAADRKAKLPAVIEKARLAIRKWKRLGPRELATLAFVFLRTEDSGYECGIPGLAPVCAVGAGLKVPACFPAFGTYGHRFAADTAKGFAAISGGDGLAYLRAIVETYLVTWTLEDGPDWDGKTEPAPDGYFTDLSSDVLEFLRHLLNVEELGLLEETRAGRKQLADQIKALPWYAEEYEKAKQAGGAGLDSLLQEREAA